MNILRLVIGALGGLSATGPMTILMQRWHRELPAAEQYSLPPKEITHQVAEKAGVELEHGSEATASLVLFNHFAYGTAAGLVYSLVAGSGRNGLLRGGVFGIAVWLVSYLGLLPAVSVLTSAKDHPAQRNVLMLSAHVVWGIILGLFVETMAEDRRRNCSALTSRSPVAARDTET